MKIGDRAGVIGGEHDHQAADGSERRQADRNSDHAVEKITDRKPLGSRILAGCAFKNRIDGGSEIGTQHKRKSCLRRHRSLRGKRHDQQHDSDTRMCCPGEARGQNHVEQGLRGDRAQQETQAWYVLIRSEQIDKVLKCHQHQAEADEHTTKIPWGGRRTPEHEDPDQDQGRRDLGDIE